MSTLLQDASTGRISPGVRRGVHRCALRAIKNGLGNEHFREQILEKNGTAQLQVNYLGVLVQCAALGHAVQLLQIQESEEEFVNKHQAKLVCLPYRLSWKSAVLRQIQSLPTWRKRVLSQYHDQLLPAMVN